MHNRRSDFSTGTLQKQELTLKVHCFWRFLARKKEREKTLFLYTLTRSEAQRQRIVRQLRKNESDSDGAPEDKEKIWRERLSLPASGRARKGASW
jgi:hypothetical protein